VAKKRRSKLGRVLSPSEIRRRGFIVHGSVFHIKDRNLWAFQMQTSALDSQGKPIRKRRYFKTREEAEEARRQSATHPLLGAGTGPYGSIKLRLRNLLTQWLADYAATHVRPSTLKRYEELVNVHLISGLGYASVAHLEPRTIEKFYQSLHGKVSPTTAHHVASLLRQALKYGIGKGLVDRNPADLVEKPSRVRFEPELWSQEQAARFLNGARETTYFHLWALLMDTGLRLGEALALTWNDLDLKEGWLRVRGGKTANARRGVKLTPELVQELRAIRGVGLVFHRKDGRAMSQWTVRDNFYALLDHLGLPRMRIHDLRHFNATLQIRQGVDIATVSARLGHSSRAFTLATYAHSMTSGQDEAAKAVSSYLYAQKARVPQVHH